MDNEADRYPPPSGPAVTSGGAGRNASFPGITVGSAMFHMGGAGGSSSTVLPQQVIDALPACPTCGGSANRQVESGFGVCLDCRKHPGRMDVFRALAIARAVMDPDGGDRFSGDEELDEVRLAVRGVKP